jgi:PAN domain
MKILSLVSTFILISLLTIHSVSALTFKRNINWNGNNWALGCDFHGNDLTNVQIRGEDCGGKCAQTSGCTHFTWTTYNGGTCWMKSGPVSKNDARSTHDPSMVCGVIDSPTSNTGIGTVLSGVLATRHAAYEHGACALPASDYAIVNPVALGDIASLQNLKFRPELCGQVLQVDCGHGPLNIIITNSNYGGGLDLYASTWDKLTNHASPGQTHCKVQLTSLNAFNFDGARCFYKPGTDFNNAYYHNVGLLNTKGRKVIKATIDDRAGEHRGDNPYYAFNFGPIDGNKQVIFTLDDGTTQTVYLRDCEYQQNEQYWS